MQSSSAGDHGVADSDLFAPSAILEGDLAPDSGFDGDIGEDLSALSWVHEELRRSLDAANKALRRQLREADSLKGSDVDAVDPAVLRTARQQLHQGVGALELVALPAAATLMRACEVAVQRYISKPERVDAAGVDAIEKASFALLDYIARMLAGKDVSPLSLFPQYRAVQELTGADRVHPADLWSHEWQWHDLPDDPSATPLQPDAATRTALEQQLLALMRGGNPAFTAARMSDLCAGLGSGALRHDQALLWKLAAAFFEGLSQGLLVTDVFSKRVASRLLAQFRIIERGGKEVSERLAQDILFFCSQSESPGAGMQAPRLAAVRQAYGLAWQPIVDYSAKSLGRFDPLWVTQARKRVIAAKDTWSAVAAAELHRLAGLSEQFTLVGDSIERLFPGGDDLSLELMNAINQTIASEDAPSAMLAMEVATSMLYIEAALEDIDFDSPGQEQRIRRLAQRIAAVRSGRAPEPLEQWMEDLYHRVSHRQTMGSVVQELRASLTEAEQAIDTFFRDPSERDVLGPVPGQLLAMRGVLAVLGMDHAQHAVGRMSEDVETMLTTGADSDEIRRSANFERLADNLGALDFVIDMVGVQPHLAKHVFVYDAEAGTLKPLAGRAADGRQLPIEKKARPVKPRLIEQVQSLALNAARDNIPVSEVTRELQRLSQQALANDQPALAATVSRAKTALENARDDAEVAAARDQLSAAMADFVTTASDQAGLEPVAHPTPLTEPGALAEPPAELPLAGSAAPAMAPGEDDEMLGVFLEEAHEVIGTAREALQALGHAREDLGEMTTLRRAFHTLKGSSRMVGLKAFGDAGWACEQVLNARLAEQLPADDDLLDFSGEAVAYLDSWIGSIERGDGDGGHAAGPIEDAADALRRTGRHAQPIPAPASSVPSGMVPLGLPDDLPTADDLDPSQWPAAETFTDEPAPGLLQSSPVPLDDTPPEALPTAVTTEIESFEEAIAELQAPEVPFELDMDLGNAPIDPEALEAIASDIPSEPMPLPALDTMVEADVPVDLPDVIEEPLAIERMALPEEFLVELPPSESVQPFEKTAAWAGAPEAGDAEAETPLPQTELDIDLEKVEPVAGADTGSFNAAGFEHVELAAPSLELPEVTEVADEPEASEESAAQGQGHPAEPERQREAGPEPVPVELSEQELAAFEPQTFEASGTPAFGVHAAPIEEEALLEPFSERPLHEPEPEPSVELHPELLADPRAELLPEVQGEVHHEHEHEHEHEHAETDGLRPPGEPAPETSEAAVSAEHEVEVPAFDAHYEDQIRMVGPLRISIPLFNIYLTEADELSRRLITELAEWAHELHRPVGETSIALAHSLGGSSSTVGFRDLSHLSRLLESALGRSQAMGHGTADEAALFIDVAEEIRRLLHQFAAGFLKAPPQALLDRLAEHEVASARLLEAMNIAAGLRSERSDFSPLEPAQLSEFSGLLDSWQSDSDEDAPREVDAVLPDEEPPSIFIDDRAPDHGETREEVEREEDGSSNIEDVAEPEVMPELRESPELASADELEDAAESPAHPGWAELQELAEMHAPVGYVQPEAVESHADASVHEARQPLDRPFPRAPLDVDAASDTSTDVGDEPRDVPAEVHADADTGADADAVAQARDEQIERDELAELLREGDDEHDAVPSNFAPSGFAELTQVELKPLAELPTIETDLTRRLGSLHFDDHSETTEDDDDIDAVDAVDAELFPIFEEEAMELLPQLANQMRSWARRPSDPAGATPVMRTLHTFKGGARLAGAMRLGEMAHRMETRIENVLRSDAIAAADVEALEGRSDALNAALEALRRKQAAAIAQPGHETSAAEQTYVDVEVLHEQVPPQLPELTAIPAIEPGVELEPVPVLPPAIEELVDPINEQIERQIEEQTSGYSSGLEGIEPESFVERLPEPIPQPQAEFRADFEPELPAEPAPGFEPEPVAPEYMEPTALVQPDTQAEPPVLRDVVEPDELEQTQRARPGALPHAATSQSPGEIDWARFPVAEVRTPAAAKSASQQTVSAVRVRAPLLERMVNQAGEVSITRSRLESEVGLIKSSLGDLTDNLQRLREQLRDVEFQAETQLSSRLEAAKAASQAFDPLEFDRFTRLQELTRMMAESVNDVATVQRTLQRALESTEDQLAAQARLTRELQDDLLRTRMVEFEGLSDRLYRVVRQAAKETGKQVRLDIVGGSIEVDRGVLDRMTGAFEHLVRNAVTHGIELPAERTQAGKDPIGTIVVALTHEGNEVGVEFRDDGAGLDLLRIRDKGVALKLLEPGLPYSDSELANLIFAPGFSTASVITELAGRGIGMDVVRSEVNALGGRIETATAWGKGASFRLLLPLTTAVTQVVMVRSGDSTVAVPSTLVEIVRRASPDELDKAYATGHFDVGDRSVPFFWLGALLQHSRRGPDHNGRTLPVVVIRSAQQRVALHVDEVLGNQEVVVKNLGPQMSRMPGLVGITLLASGGMTLIYNPVALAALYGDSAHAAMNAAAAEQLLPAQPVTAAPQQTAAPLILVVDDSLTVRRVTQRLLQREGYRVALAKDGLDALERLAAERPAVVLSDIEMPRMDGFDLVRNIRGDADLRNLPVIMITSRIAQKHRDYAAELGVDHYLGKPYSEEDLIALIGSYVGAAALASQY